VAKAEKATRPIFSKSLKLTMVHDTWPWVTAAMGLIGVILTKYMYLIIYLTTMIKPPYTQVLIGMGCIVLVN
jgi:hypothetical protein